MAKKNYAMMSTKKLNALMETASEEEKVEIAKVLEARQAVAAGAAQEEETVEVPANEAEEAKEKKPVGRPVKEKLTKDERKALAADLREKHLNHRCQVVPFGTIEWVNGVIKGIIEEKRSNKVLYAVITDDGKRIVKAIDSQLIKILDEVVEPEPKVRKSRKKAVQLDENGNPIITEKTVEPWTDEEIKVAISQYVANVGKTISYPEAGVMGKVEEGAATITGRIVSLVPNKRQKTILYRVLIDDTDNKFAHKVTTAESLVIAEELDETGKAINEKYVERMNREPRQKVVLSPAEKVESAKALLVTAAEKLAQWQEVYEKRKANLEKAIAAFEAETESKAESPTEQAVDDNEELA